jgi:hypothetical protein
MFSGPIDQTRGLVSTIAMLSGAAILLGGTAAADPSQDDKFLTLLGYQDIPAIDNPAGLIETAHKVCVKLDGGMPVDDLVELIRNNGFNEDPLTRLDPPRRVTKTIDRFINASVQAYCPYDQGKIASITAQAATDPNTPTHGVAAYARNTIIPTAWQGIAGSRDARGTTLAFVIAPVPSGEVPPSNPPAIPAQQPPAPQEVQPAPRQSPPPPHRVPPVPQQAPPTHQQAEPPPQEAPPPPQQVEPPPPQETPPPPQQVEPPPPQETPPPPQQVEPPPPQQAEPPQQAQPAPPTNPPPKPAPPPEQPSAPGHVRLAP